MPFQLNQNDGAEALLTLEIDAASFEKELVRIYKQQAAAEGLQLPPLLSDRAMLATHEHFDELCSLTLDAILPSEFYRAMQEFELKPLCDPQISISYAGVGEPCLVAARLLLQPEVVLTKLEDIAVRYDRVTVSPDDEERQMAALLKKYGYAKANEKFVAAVGRHRDLDEMKADIHRTLQEMAEHLTEENQRRALLIAFAEANPVDTPEALIENRVQAEIDRLQNGIGAEMFRDVLKQKGISVDDVAADLRPDIERTAKLSLLFAAASDQLKIEVSDSELEANLLAQGVVMGQTDMEARRQQLADDPAMKTQLTRQLKIEKVTQYLLAHAALSEDKTVSILEQAPHLFGNR